MRPAVEEATTRFISNVPFFCFLANILRFLRAARGPAIMGLAGQAQSLETVVGFGSAALRHTRQVRGGLAQMVGFCRLRLSEETLKGGSPEGAHPSS
jgi:hypothetical protein